MESNISDLLWGFDSLMIFCLCFCDFTLSNSNTEICASDQVTLRQIKKSISSCWSCDKMDSDDPWLEYAVKIEIDVAEELPMSLKTEKGEQGQ